MRGDFALQDLPKVRSWNNDQFLIRLNSLIATCRIEFKLKEQINFSQDPEHYVSIIQIGIQNMKEKLNPTSSYYFRS
jgi:hypothetical protein